MTVLRFSKKLAAHAWGEVAELGYARSADHDIAGYRRVYHVHIRKTGGTSINQMFLSLVGDGPSLYNRLAASLTGRKKLNGHVFVGWNKRYINRGHYYYAFSHVPRHRLDLPPGTFTLACFRDPVQRVLSHYKMLRTFAENGIDHPCMKEEGPWLGRSLGDFIERIPPRHLLNQLYMFSERFDVNEAHDRIQNLSHILFTETFEEGVAALNGKLGLDLRPVHARKSKPRPEEGAGQHLARLREKLSEEYALLERIRAHVSSENPKPLAR